MSNLQILLKENERIIMELINIPLVENLMVFWKQNFIVNLQKISSSEIKKIVPEINKEIVKLELRKACLKKDAKIKIDPKVFYMEDDDDEKSFVFLRSSMPVAHNYNSKKNVNNYDSDKKKDESKNQNQNPIKKEDSNQKIDENELWKKQYKYIKTRIRSTNNITIGEIKFSRREEDEEEENNEAKPFLRFNNKKSSTVNINLTNVNNLELKIFNYQEERKDNNFITKTKKSKDFLNYIDIDLFFQYIAVGKSFFENENEDNNLKEGFCLQYQTFIFPETLINKLISCFDYFYSEYLNKDNKIIEEKTEEEDKEEENKSKENEENIKENEENDKSIDDIEEEVEITSEKCLNKKRRNAFKIKNSLTNEENIKKIPFGLIDFLYTFINIHNTYYHHELSRLLIGKIYNFLKKLMDINEINMKYRETLELAEIELKEYESSLKSFSPIHIENRNESQIDNLSSSGVSSDEEKIKKEEEENERNSNEGNSNERKSTERNSNERSSRERSSKERNSKERNSKERSSKERYSNERSSYEISFKERSATQVSVNNKKKSKTSVNRIVYEFDILKYSSQDIATELTRVNYLLFSKIQVKEFLKGAFSGRDKYKTSPNICNLIKRFNLLSNWVIEEILAYDHAEKRAAILLKFISIASRLSKMGNYDNCLSILTGLTNYNITKLNKTWGHISSADMATFRSLKKLLSFEDNYKNLRYEIQQKIKEKAFYIPYLGYYTKRMISYEELGPYIKKHTSLINIEKIIEVYKNLKSFYLIKQKNYKVYLEGDIKRDLVILQCLDPSNEDFLTETSNLLEPKFILSNKKLNIKRRTKTDINFLNNVKKINII